MPSKLQEPLPHFLACTRRMRGCAYKHLNGSINFLPKPLILPCNIQGNPLSAENVPSKILSLALVACDIDRHTKSKFHKTINIFYPKKQVRLNQCLHNTRIVVCMSRTCFSQSVKPVMRASNVACTIFPVSIPIQRPFPPRWRMKHSRTATGIPTK